VLEGALAITVDGKSYVAEAGDSLPLPFQPSAPLPQPEQGRHQGPVDQHAADILIQVVGQDFHSVQVT